MTTHPAPHTHAATPDLGASPVVRRGLHGVPPARRTLLRSRLLRTIVVPRLLRHIRGGTFHLVDADGTTVRGGTQPPQRHGELHITSPDAWHRIARRGNVGLGEGYVAGEWESPDLVAMLEVLARSTMASALDEPGLLARMGAAVRRLPRYVARNDRRRSKEQIGYHYDLGNEMYSMFLDPSMTYSCAVFEPADVSLELAQLEKYRRICERLELAPGMHVLEIGCGWGGFATYVAREYGVRVTALTLSEQQAEWARALVRDQGLEELVSIELRDYRDVEGQFDRIASIEMFEALGEREHQTYFRRVEELLHPAGRACIQVIGFSERDYLRIRRSDGWLRRYIFPGGACPSLGSLVEAVQDAGNLQVRDVEEIGHHYARTLEEWRMRLLDRRDDVRALGYDDAFIRGWELYLAWCEAAFRAGISRTMQIVLVPALDQTDETEAAS